MIETVEQVLGPQGETLSLSVSWNETIGEDVAQVARDLFIQGFGQNYDRAHQKSLVKESIERWLGIDQPLSEWLGGVFDQELAWMSQGIGQHAFVRIDGKLVGFMSFDPVEYNQELDQVSVYARQAVIDPSYWGFKVCDAQGNRVSLSHFLPRMVDWQQQFPHAQSLHLVVRRINTLAIRLYHHLGFQEVPSLTRQGYDDKYVGFCLDL